MSERGKKLFNDLQIVKEKIFLANSIIDSRAQDTQQIFEQLEGMNAKLSGLTEQLKEAGEDYLYRYVLAIINDV